MKRIALFAFVIAVTSICSGQWLERQIVIGDTLGGVNYTEGIVVNPLSGNVYIESEPIQIFNPRTMAKLRGPGATGMVVFCPASSRGYVVGESLVILSTLKDKVIGSDPLPFEPDLYAYSRTSNRLYLASSDNLLVYDPDADSILGTFSLGFGIDALQWDTAWNRLYIGGSHDTVELRALDCAGDTLLPGIRTGLAGLQSLALSTGSHKLYCAGVDSDDVNKVVVINTDSLSLVDTLPGMPGFDMTAYNPITDRLYLAADTEVYVLDCRSDSIRAVRDVGCYVSAITASTLTGEVYVGSNDSAQVLVMDASDSVVGSISLPSRVTDGIDALTFWSERNELYGVTGRGNAFVVDASADTVAGSVSYATTTATQMIHNPGGNKLYAFCPGIQDVLVFDSTFGTPKHIPGGVFGAYAIPVLNPTLNRIYVADANYLRTIDCNSDSLVGSKSIAGISRPLPVMIPYLNKLYVFSTSGSGDTVFAYDALKDRVSSVFSLSNSVPCAVYDQRSNHVFFACKSAPTILVLDPTTDSVVKTFGLGGGSSKGRMALNPDLGHLYYTDQGSDRMYTIDVLADSVIASASLPWDIDTMFLDRRLQKLYMCARDHAEILAYDCNQSMMVDTIAADYHYAGLLDEINDKLYLRYGAVVDCRYDSVVTMLPGSLSPRSMAWDAIDNRVFQATTSRLYVYRDDPYGVEERKVVDLRPMLAVLGNPARNAVSLRLQIPPGQTGILKLHDVAGRLVRSLSVTRTSVLRLDLKSMPAGVYLISLEVSGRRSTDKVVVEH